MARMHTRRRGSSDSDKPAVDEPPAWSDVEDAAIEERVVELADAGHSPSEIGLTLRDEGVEGTPIPDVSLATGKKVTEILAEQDADPDLPEDLRNLFERAVRLDHHMDDNPTDYQNKRALQNTESKIRRLADYYLGDEIAEDFEYTAENARERLE
ncbi:MAG: 30S ribosomal protein S15 [Haloarculaceae archaeon]